MFIRLLSVLLLPIFVTIPAFAGNWQPFEVMTAAKGRVILQAYSEQAGPAFETPKRCVFTVLDAETFQATTTLIRQNPDFYFSANPSAAIGDDGTLHVVCMSLKKDYSSGVLEYSRSTDGGKSWSPFVTVVRRDGGIADKPFLTAASDGTLTLAFTDIGVLPREVTGRIAILSSPDSGQTWTPAKMIEGATELKEAHNVSGFQGAALSNTVNGLVLTFSEYGGGAVYQCKIVGQKCKIPILVGQTDIRTPITQLIHGQDAKNFAILIYGAHAFGAVDLFRTFDGGETWTKRRLAGAGTMASAVVIGNDLVVLMSEIDQVTTQLHKVNWETLEERSRLELETGKSMHPSLYIGAYQQLAVLNSSNLLSTWISFAPDQTTIKRSVKTLDGSDWHLISTHLN